MQEELFLPVAPTYFCNWEGQHKSILRRVVFSVGKTLRLSRWRLFASLEGDESGADVGLFPVEVAEKGVQGLLQAHGQTRHRNAVKNAG